VSQIPPAGASGAIRTITPTTARRLAVTRQRLAGPRPPADADGILEVMRDLGCLQIDPISVVARSHLLVLWSRLGPYDVAHLDQLLWEDRKLFEYWAHAASIVLTEDFPIHGLLMRRYPTDRYAHNRRLKVWIEENDALRRHVLQRLRAEGPLRARDLEDRSVRAWSSSGWTADRNVDRVLDYLWTKGEVVVAGRRGGQKVWDLAESWFPDWTPRDRLPEDEVVRRSVERSVRALGVARPAHIQEHFTRGRYAGLPAALTRLQRRGLLQTVRVADRHSAWPGPWFVHQDDLELLDRLEEGNWQPRTTLLSPFDNLICDRARAELLFGFTFRIEIYVPKPQRRYGYYVMPVLHGDRLIGRIDPMLDRPSGRLIINAVHVEPEAPVTQKAGIAVAGAVEELARFLEAKEIEYPGAVPEAWRRFLK